LGHHWSGPNQNGPATMDWQPTAEAGELAHGTRWWRHRPIPTAGSETGGGGGSGRMPAGWTLDLRWWGGGRLTRVYPPRRHARVGGGRRCWAAQAVKELGWPFGEQHSPSAQLREVAADRLGIGGTLSTARHRRGRWLTASACFGQLFAVVGNLGKIPTLRRWATVA
jgi:hypothetical protein